MWVALLIVLIAAASYGAVNIQSPELRGWIGALIAAAFLLGMQRYLITRANRMRSHDQTPLTFFDLIVTSEDNCYTLPDLYLDRVGSACVRPNRVRYSCHSRRPRFNRRAHGN